MAGKTPSNFTVVNRPGVNLQRPETAVVGRLRSASGELGRLRWDRVRAEVASLCLSLSTAFRLPDPPLTTS